MTTTILEPTKSNTPHNPPSRRRRAAAPGPLATCAAAVQTCRRAGADWVAVSRCVDAAPACARPR